MKGETPIPPSSPFRFLAWFCPPALYESIEGDLIEEFEKDAMHYGEKIARRRLLWNVLRFFRPGILLRNNYSLNLIHTIMIANYFTVASRNIAKRKLYSFINAFGLSIGISICVLIFLYIRDEKQFDQFHANKDQLLMMTEKRFSADAYKNGEPEPYQYSPILPAKLSEVMADEIPEVKYATRFSSGSGIMRYEDKIFNQRISYCDSSFFKMFSFKLIKGNPDKIFANPAEAVLTKSIAEKYFGQEDPIGKEFNFFEDKELTFTVVGIIEAPPANSSIDFEILLPVVNKPYFANNRDSWGAYSYGVFIQLHEKSNLQSFHQNLENLTEKYIGERNASRREHAQIPAEYIVSQFGYIKLVDVHLDTTIRWHKSSDPQYSFILAAIGFLILLIACINYISLALTTSTARRVEVGIRKVVGAQKKQLIFQFAFESVILSFISMLIGLLLVVLFLPAFNTFTGKSIVLVSQTILQMFGVSLALSLGVGLLAGSYPALFLSGFLPALVLKGKYTSRLQAGFTKPLVVLQFALSAFLIISSVIMYQQMKFVTTKDLGFDKDQVIVINTNAGWNEAADKSVLRLRTEIENYPGVLGVSGTSSSFNRGWSHYGYKINGENKSSFVFRIDHEYIDLLNIPLVLGRNFDPRIPSDSTGIIVNEALVKDMGWENPLEEHLNWQQDSTSLGSKIIGVVKDYHFLSLERDIEPMFLSMDKERVGYMTTTLVKIQSQNIPQTTEQVKKAWLTLNPDKPFEYTFMDEDIARQYSTYQRWMKIMALSTVFAIVIACLGLFGLAGINVVNRTKEIGIRKVLGAELPTIFILLNKQYIILAAFAFALATPLSIYFMNKWLSGFKFAITPGWELFVVSMVSGLLIALITVSYHSIKAALINPAETLKYE